MYDTILVPVDDSAETTRLLEDAIEVARTWNATVQTLGLVDGPEALKAEARENNDRVRGARERARRATMRATERARRAGLESSGTVRRGVPHTEILAQAAESDADLVVLGPSGRMGSSGPLCSGRVTQNVVDTAERAVLVSPLDDSEEDEAPESEGVTDQARLTVPLAE